MDRSQIVKHKKTGRLFQLVDLIAFPKPGHEAYGAVWTAYQLSAYDGMPIGSKVHLAESEVE